MVLCMTALVACNQKNSKNEDLLLTHQADSLNRIIEQKDNEINDMMSTMNDIEEGFRAINEAEQRVTLANTGESSTSKERIRENLQFITERMAAGLALL